MMKKYKFGASIANKSEVGKAVTKKSVEKTAAMSPKIICWLFMSGEVRGSASITKVKKYIVQSVKVNLSKSRGDCPGKLLKIKRVAVERIVKNPR